MYHIYRSGLLLEMASLVVTLAFLFCVFKLFLWIDSQAYGLSWINGVSHNNRKELVGILPPYCFLHVTRLM